MEKLSIGDGFRFGCGFFLAAFLVWLAMAIIGGVLMAIFGAGLGALLGNMDLESLSQLPLLLSVI